MMPELKPGDVFCVRGSGFLPSAIRFVERLTSFDGAKYNHAGIILNANGTTFEALWTLRKSHINDYRGKQIMVVRPVIDINNRLITRAEKIRAYTRVMREHEGQIYPGWRLFLHLCKPLSKMFIKGWPKVCSEITAKDLVYLRCWRGTFAGVNPDNLADEWRDSRLYNVVYEGVWE